MPTNKAEHINDNLQEDYKNHLERESLSELLDNYFDLICENNYTTSKETLIKLIQNEDPTGERDGGYER